MPEVILSAQNLVKYYPIKKGVLRRIVGQVKAVDGVSFDLHKGETLGIVGESGCGKSTLGRLLMRLEEPTAGKVIFEGADWSSASGREMRRMRRDIQIVFQDPYTSLNPRMTVGDIIGEPFEIHKDVVPKGGRRKRVQELLDLVGLNPEHINRYPHQFSGGQRQRIGIARGIALNPKVLVCDEPVSALDVSVQAQVVNLMEKLQDELGLAYVFIAHDLSVVRHISDRVGVMYLGRMAELGEEDEVYTRPTHPYTQALLSAVPVPDPTLRGKREQIVLVGDVPSPANPPSGCRFHTRCWKAQEICSAGGAAARDAARRGRRAPLGVPLRRAAHDRRDGRRLATSSRTPGSRRPTRPTSTTSGPASVPPAAVRTSTPRPSMPGRSGPARCTPTPTASRRTAPGSSTSSPRTTGRRLPERRRAHGHDEQRPPGTPGAAVVRGQSSVVGVRARSRRRSESRRDGPAGPAAPLSTQASRAHSSSSCVQPRGHCAVPGSRSGKCWMIRAGSTWASPKDRMPGVSMIQPSSSGSASATADDEVCRPRPVTSLTTPVARSARGTRALTRVVLPTPE